MQVIARVGGLTLLNGSEVHHYERRDSELQYLRRILGEVSYPAFCVIIARYQCASIGIAMTSLACHQVTWRHWAMASNAQRWKQRIQGSHTWRRSMA